MCERTFVRLTSSLDPMQVGAMVPQYYLKLLDISLERAWFGPDTILFIQFISIGDQLRAPKAKRRLFCLLGKIFLDVDLTRSQVV